MSIIQPYYPSKFIIVDSDSRISGTNTNFKVELSNNECPSEGNFYCRLVDMTIQQNDRPGIPYDMCGFVGLHSSLASSSSVIGCKKQDGSYNNSLESIIGFCMNKSEPMDTEFLGDLTDDNKSYDYGKVNMNISPAWFPISAPRGLVDFRLVDAEGDDLDRTLGQPQQAMTTLDGNTDYVNEFTETVDVITFVLEVKHVSTRDEIKNALKVRRDMLPI